ncbi:hypothetical protein CY34DRAFT_26308 [Suillus luteus UH-Slu-Lm8-n1]|uniref:Uncharacterized protein n=1 Tax=Suillus luteus UH-Slu-Lm8-n1 TaxID=930992 RepID=A0A0D0AXF2_9AGAM|nr:hypothetical protein CY34DRAFT_26308 [Suillus luteus UH-Slu-Lm8-n1]
MMLVRYLVWLPTYDETSVIKLLHSDNPQDVPRAIELMQAIVDFSKSQHALLNDSFSSNVKTRADLMSIKLLSYVIKSILMPFINIKLLLSEQVHHLSCYSHLAFTIFCSCMIGGHNSRCMYSQTLNCLGAAKYIDDMFKRHSELDPGHQCLSLGKCIEDIDHINW